MTNLGACQRCGSAPKLIGYYVEGGHAVDVRCTNSKCMNGVISTHVDDWPRKPFITITSTCPMGPIAIGDVMKIADTRSRWLKLWHWLRFWKPRPVFEFTITSVPDSTTAGLVVSIDLSAAEKGYSDIPRHCRHYDSEEGCTSPDCDCREVDPDDDMGDRR